MARKIQHKRGLEANLPQLDVAEIAFTTDSKKPFIGSADGNVEIAKKADVDAKASKTELTNAVSPKADKTYVDTELGKKASTDEVSAVSAQLADKANQIDIGDLSTLQTQAKDKVVNAINSALIGDPGKKYKVVACVIRNDGTGWKMIQDGTHQPLNVASVTSDTSYITISLPFTANKILSAVVTPDEVFAKEGVVFGNSVGRDSIIITAYAAPKTVGGYLSYNGTNFVFSGMTGGFEIGTFNTATGVLPLTHPNFGVNTLASVSSRGPYTAKLESTGGASTQVVWYDNTGNVVKTPDTNMKAFVTRSLAGTIVAPDNLTYPGSNIWVYGIYEVA